MIQMPDEPAADAPAQPQPQQAANPPLQAVKPPRRAAAVQRTVRDYTPAPVAKHSLRGE